MVVVVGGVYGDAVGPDDLGPRLSYCAWHRPRHAGHDGGLCQVVILALASRPLWRGARALLKGFIMNYEGHEPETYYPDQEQKHLNEVKCWCFAVIIFLAGCAAAGLILVSVSLSRWLLGGA